MAQENARIVALPGASANLQMSAVLSSPVSRIAAARSGMRLFGEFQSGQVLAGTGALVFEGELLEQPRCH
ncbi:MAG: hypothetical protein R3D32_06720 [Nitratireductor sp.]